MSSSPLAISPGHLVGGGHYSLHVPLGESGLLWLGQNEEKQQLAVLRFLPAELRQDDRVWITLQERVKRALAVTHPNLCRMVEWYESPGVDSFIAFEYVEGKPLAEALGAATEPIAWKKLQPAVAAIAAALRALHGAGIVHHGIQPTNLMMAAEGGVKVIGSVVTGILLNPLFRPAALNELESLRYLSPQQLQGEEATPADDFYSLGATLYEWITGTPVFQDSPSLVQDIRFTPPQSIAERLAAVENTNYLPDEVAGFIMACLSKDPAQRPAGLDAIAPSDTVPVAVLPTERDQTSAVPELNPRQAPVDALPTDWEPCEESRRSWVLAACAILFVGLITGAGWWFFDYQRTERVKSATAQRSALEEAQRQKVLAEERRLHALEMEEKRQEELEARRRAEQALREKAEEAARLQAAIDAQGAQNVTAAETLPEGLRIAAPLQPSSIDDQFVELFNGRDLNGWNGDTNIWSVKDGHITAIATANTPKQRYHLTWEKEPVRDFELHFSYRFRVLRGNKSPNGGVLYRGQTAGTNIGYQFELTTDFLHNGAVTDDGRRKQLAGRGESVVAKPGDQLEILEQLTEANQLKSIRPEDWNRCVILARDNRLTHYINGVLVADVLDEHTRREYRSGVLALELNTRNTNNPAAFLQFKDLRVKKLTVSDAGMASAAN